MLEFQEKKNIRRFLYAKPTLFFIAVILLFSLNSTYKMYEKAAETNGDRSLTLREKETLLAKENELSERISKLKTERGMEEEIRNKYRVVKNGEGVIIVVGAGENQANAAAATSTASLFYRIKGWFTP